MGGMTSTKAPRPADICSYSSVVKLSISTNTQCLDRLLQVFNDLASRLIILLLEPVAKKKKKQYTVVQEFTGFAVSLRQLRVSLP